MPSHPGRPSAAMVLPRLGFEPDPWQLRVLDGGHRRLLLNCSRQAGKSTAVALLSLVEALYYPGALILLLSRSLRQSRELFRLVADFHRRLNGPWLERRTAHELTFKHKSRIVSLPCSGDTIRGFANVHMLVIDEAARVPDDLYRSVRPMLAVSHGRLICLSTPQGRSGFFYQAWAAGGDDWERIEVPARDVPRIAPEFLDEERRCLGDAYFRQEYECSFEALAGLVYPDFSRCVVPALPPDLDQPGAGKKVGGIDFGFRNPFAAVWGLVDKDDVLWLTGEHYEAHQPLSHHAARLSKDVIYYADPSGAADIAALRYADYKVQKGENAVRQGIMAVSSRLAHGTLKVVAGRCPNLLAEAALYRYSPEEMDRRSESPLDEHNHALAALRYLICSIDAYKLARPRPQATPATPAADAPAEKPAPPWWLDPNTEYLWQRVT